MPVSTRFVVFAACALLALPACQRQDALPDPESDAYREAVTAFYTGVAAVQAGEDLGAEDNLLRAAELAPGEPAAWVNLGVLALRRNELDVARARLERAQALAPDDSRVALLLALLASSEGRPEEAVAQLRRARALDPGNLQAGYALAQALEQQSATTPPDEVQQLLAELQEAAPGNLALLAEQARVAALRSDAAALQEALATLRSRADGWPQETRDQLGAVEAAAASGDDRAAATQVAFLKNLLLSLPAYRRDLRALQAPPEQIGDLMLRFLRLPPPNATPAPPDEALTFTPTPLPVPETGTWAWAGPFWRTGDSGPAAAAAGTQGLWLGEEQAVDFGAVVPPASAGPPGVVPFDYNYDFLTDVAVAGADGLRLYAQDSTTGAFADVTGSLGLPPDVTGGAYAGGWTADFDLEGDLDLLLSQADGPPRVLRNNGDGTFEAQPRFETVRGLRDFVWTDLDADGDPDAALLDAEGRLHVFVNERMGAFQERPVPADVAGLQALTAADANADGLVDLIVLRQDGALLRLSGQEEGRGWDAAPLARWDALPEGMAPGAARLFMADLDNNGSLDVLASTPGATQAWMGDVQGVLYPLAASIAAYVQGIADVNGDGRLDLLGLSAENQPVLLTNAGATDYHWQMLRLRASFASGDQRINTFALGSVAEVRAGLLFQKQPITQPAAHFGLGQQDRADLVRIVWPNGDVQAEFALAPDQTLLTPQRLKGSCPWVFTFDGEGMQFVTDFLWRSPLGLRINAQETAGVMTTEDWIRIRGDQLVPRDGVYDVRITAELWETHFFDHVALLVVDHPAATEVFVDERFAFPPPAMAVHLTAPLRPVAGAWDDRGRDVTGVVHARDGRYLDTFGPGAYQGVTRDHYVEVALGDDVPTDGPLRLVASGWVRPTDSSINVALSQGSHAPPQGLVLEVPDGRGGWRVAKEGLGFPAGKTKTVVLDLEGVFAPGTPRRLRLRTNLEVYWDALAWTTALPDADLRTQRLDPAVADLRHRGFSALAAPDRSSPEVPDYQVLAGTAPRWQDLEGYYTRFGDVRPLLKTVDDRYVIMNAGDELRFQFAAPPPPPAGWVRDFVLIGDGWVKDGDYNTAFSRTVRPLPAHDDPAYTTPPGRLQEDPVYQRHAGDWQTFHTRYVAPEVFHFALVPEKPAPTLHAGAPERP